MTNLKNAGANLAKEILLFLLHVAKTPYVAFLTTPYKSYIPKKKYYQKIIDLKNAGYVKREGKYLKLTPKGKQKALYVKWGLKKINIKNWDGKWRMISFDVPEKKKNLRECLRRKLQYLNFAKMQDSVWVTPLPIEREIGELLQILEIKYFVRYIVVEKINYDADLRKKFFTK